MSYVSESLTLNEKVVRSANLHWVIYVKGFVLLALALLVFFLIPSDVEGELKYWSLLLTLPGLYLLFMAFLKNYTTELVVTNKKVLAKVGLIRRDTIEQKLASLDNVQVNQSVMGRILNYGTIIISGSGGQHTPIVHIASPMKFRVAVQRADDEIGV